MVCDDACLGIPDLRRREQGLPTVDALDGVDHSSSSEHLPRWSSTALYVGMGWMAVIAIVPLVRSLPVSVT
jgi:predicted membrane channel-forming protein YqfA (hemolysin III family)